MTSQCKWSILKEQEINLKWILRNLFGWCSNLSNDDIISKRPGLKTGVKNDIFWSEIGSGFGELDGTPHEEFPGEPPL